MRARRALIGLNTATFNVAQRMTGRFEADLPDFDFAAQFFTSFVAEWRNGLALAASYKTELDQEWDGGAKNQFDELFTLWSDNAVLIADAGADLATFVSTARTNYAEGARANAAFWTGSEPDRISVNPSSYADAAAIFRNQATVVDNAFQNALSTMSGCSTMGGDDPAGTEWAQNYDNATGVATGNISALMDELLQFTDLLDLTADNHAAAEIASRLSGVASDVSIPVTRQAICLAGPPSAVGGSGAEPDGWEWIRDFGGHVWPDGDTGKIKTAAGAWWNLGDSLSALETNLLAAMDSVDGNWSAETSGLRTAWADLRQMIADIKGDLYILSGATTGYADAVDTAHNELIHTALAIVIAEVATHAVGITLAPVTFGMSEVAAAGIGAGELAIAAARATTIIGRLSTVGRSMIAELAAIAAVIRAWRAGVSGSLLKATTISVNPYTPKVTSVVNSALSDAGKVLLDVAVGTGAGVGVRVPFSAKTAAEKMAMYEAYVARKIKEGNTPRSYQDWYVRADRISSNTIKGARFEAEQAKDLGITIGRGGWTKDNPRIPIPGTKNFRKPDLFNVEDKIAYEFKSGKGSKGDILQMQRDAILVDKRDWKVTWRVSKDYEPEFLAELERLATQYPGEFKYEVV